MYECRRVVQFYFKKNIYNMYLDNRNKHFFLKSDLDGNLSYLTIYELFELSRCLIEVPLYYEYKKR